MNNRILTLGVWLILIIWTASVKPDDFHPHQLIIRLPSTLAKSSLSRLPVSIHHSTLLFNDHLHHSYYLLEIEDSVDLTIAFRELSAYGYPIYYNHILHACRDIVPPNDPRYSDQPHLSRIQAPLAWEYFKGNGTVPVYILDSGVDYHHPDLVPSLYHNPGEIANGLDDDHNGLIDDTIGYDFVTVDPGQTDNGDGYPPDNDVMDCASHGTSVAGIAGAATNNGIGLAAMNWNARLYPIRVAYSYQGSLDAMESDVINGIEYALSMGARVISFSYGGIAKTPALHAAIQKATYQGALFLAAAGNEFTETKYYPSAYPEAIAVTALYSNDMNASYVYGSWIDLAAPCKMMTTLPNNRYDSPSGTSMATPLVAAAMAYLMEYRPTYSSSQIQHLLYRCADSLDQKNPAIRNKLGYGRINIGRAFQSADSLSLVLADSFRLQSSQTDLPMQSGQSVILNFQLYNPGPNPQPPSSMDLSFPLQAGYVQSSLNPIDLPELAVGQRWQSPDILLSLSDQLPFESELLGQLTVTSGSQRLYSINQVLEPKINPIFHTLHTGNLACSFSSIGLIGHNDVVSFSKYHPYSEYYLGDGILYRDFPDICFTAGCWFGGSNTPVYDGTLKNTVKTLSEWVQHTPWQIDTLNNGLIVLQSSFASDTADPTIRIRQSIYSFPDSNYFLLHYTVYNYSSQPVINPRFGLFWELDMIRYTQNQVTLDTARNMIVQHYQTSLYTGIACLKGDNPRYRSITDYCNLNLADNQKFICLNNSSISNETGDMAVLISNGVTDQQLEIYSQMPDSLDGWYFMSVAENQELLNQRLESARSALNSIITDIADSERPDARPPCIRLYPNPAGHKITVEYAHMEPGTYHLRLFNLLGQPIWETQLSFSSEGMIPLCLPELPNGVFFIKLHRSSITSIHKIMILK
ncbi:MAG: S8 family serine peptidase [Candidatus Delongbacteria bacterium]|nr:S8 family serine peptidase [Candidatus Delongbacteria bacterium]